MSSKSRRPINFRWLGRIDYTAALDLQYRLAEQRREGEIPDTILLLEHQPVYTIGRTRDQSSLKERDSLTHPVVEINRGGQATFHGPGQLVGYPILDLTAYGKDLHRYVRALEEALIATCLDHDVAAGRRKNLTGVWVGKKKIASIGVGVRRWISMHGFAINVCGDLSPFEAIIPCGIENVALTSLEIESRHPLSVESYEKALRPRLSEILCGLQVTAT